MMKPKEIIESEYLTIEESFQPVLILTTVHLDQKCYSQKLSNINMIHTV